MSDLKTAEALDLAGKLLAEARMLKEHRELVIAYRRYLRAIELFESYGDLGKAETKSELAAIYEECGWCCERARHEKTRSIGTPWSALRHAWLRKSVDLYNTTLKFDSEAELENVFAQINRMYNLAMYLMQSSLYLEAQELVTAQLAHYRRLVAETGVQDLNTEMDAQRQLLICAEGLQEKERAIAIANAALKLVDPTKCESWSIMQSYGEVCAIKSRLVQRES